MERLTSSLTKGGQKSGGGGKLGGTLGAGLGCAGILIVVFLLLIVGRQHIYLFRQVKDDQVGIKIRGNQIVAILSSGVYSDVGLFVRLETFSTQEYKFTAMDPEVITLDQQRIGVGVSGSVFRPSLAESESIKRLWTQYKTLYTNDDALQRKMEELSFQAMKVCVGDRPFADSIIGSDRDALRECIDSELNDLTKPFGLLVQNVVVPNVTLSPEVQQKLDAITQSRLDTEKAVQDQQKAVAEGKAQQAKQEADIRVEQAKKQEEARQQTTLAQLEVERLKAQLAQIDAQKANELLAAQKELEIAEARALAAAEQAKADLAQQTALALLYSTNPEYVALLMAQTNASAIKSTDKMIFVPDGVFPNLIFGTAMPTITLPQYGPAAPDTTTPDATTPGTTTP